MSCLGNAWDELGVLIKLSLPSTLINSSDVALCLITIITLGYSDTDDLAAASIGIAYINMIWYFVEGFLTAQDSLSYEAFIVVHNRGLNIEGISDFDKSRASSRGATLYSLTPISKAGNDYDEDDDNRNAEDVRFSEARSPTGVRSRGSKDQYYRHSSGARGIRYWTYVSSVLFAPLGAACVSICLLSFVIIPNYLNVDAQLATKASAFVITSIPSLLLLYMCRVLQKHIQAFGIINPSVLSGAVAVIVHLLVSYLSVFPIRGGYIGAAVAFLFTRTATLLVLLYHIVKHPHLDVSWYLLGREITVIGAYIHLRRVLRRMSLRVRRLKDSISPGSTLQRYFAVFGPSSRSRSIDSSGDRDGSSDGVEDDADKDDDEVETEQGGVALVSMTDREIAQPPSGRSSRRSLARAANRNRGVRPGVTKDRRSVEIASGPDINAVSELGDSANPAPVGSGVQALAVFVNNSGPLTRNILRFLVLGLSGGVILGLEVWSFDLGTILASYIGPVTLSAHTILLMWTIFLYVLMPFAVSIAASVRVHSLIRARNAAGAELTANTVLILAFVIACVNAGLTYSSRDVLGYLFSSDKYTRGRVAALAPVAALFQFVNALEACAQGVLRGCGRQGLVVGLNVLSLWVFGFPAGLLMTFYARPTAGIYGIWYGFTLGVGMQAVVLLWLVWTFDWEREVRRARARDHEDPLYIDKKNAEQDDHDEVVEEAEGLLGRRGGENGGSLRSQSNPFSEAPASEPSVSRPGARAVGSFLCRRAGPTLDSDDDVDDDERIGITELYSPTKAPLALV